MKNRRDKIYIRRDLEQEIGRYMKDPEMIAVLGPRQSGKTTLLQRIHSGLENAAFITLEDTRVLEMFDEDPDSFIDRYVKGRDYLLIDEIQYSERAGKNLKYIYDTQDIKMFITGSSSTELSLKGLKYLTGRVLIFRLFPLSFREFLRFRDRGLYDSTAKRLSPPLVKAVMPHFREFVLYGGYPRVVLESDPGKKRKVLEGIHNIFMLREMGEILGIKDRKRLSGLLRTLSLQAGKLVNYDKISSESGYSYHELKEKMGILQETFVCGEARPFFTNRRTELVKNPKIFFFDNGLRNSVIDSFARDRTDLGELYENFVFSEMVKMAIEPRFWRSKGKAEVDFVVESEGRRIAIEVKRLLSKTVLTKSFISFLEKYSPDNGYILSEDFLGERKFGGVSVKYYPLFYVSRLLDAHPPYSRKGK